MEKNKTIAQKVVSPAKAMKSWNWRLIITIFSVVSLMALYTWTVYHFANKEVVDFQQVEKVEIGMTKDEVFTHLEDFGWSEYDERGYQYSWRFKSPSGNKKTFLVTIKDDVVTDIATQ